MHRPCPSSPSSTQGFALVIALSLMAFVLLLLLSITTLVQVETRSSQAQSNITHARANALLALNIALGELQKHAGPDQRISARAEILDTDASTETIDGVNQPQWTGIWKTGDAFLDVGSTPQREISLGDLNPTSEQKADAAHWLVSGNTDPASPITPLTAPTANWVTMAQALGATSEDVRVPAVPVSDTNGIERGRYGYWISDEGVKAKLAFNDTSFGTTGRMQSQARLLSPTSNFMNEIVPLSPAASDFRETPFAEIQKLVHPESIGLLSTVDETSVDLPKIKPDVTVYSKGVLSDVRNGGLKTDLTAIMEDSAAFFEWFGEDSEILYNVRTDSIPAPSSTPNNIQSWGPSWNSLYYYYNSYKDTLPSFDPNFPGNLQGGIGNAETTTAYSVQPRVYYSAPWLYGHIMPFVVGMKLDISLASRLVSLGADSADPNDDIFEVEIRYHPAAVLYNPYSVELSLPDFNFDFRLGHWKPDESVVSVNGSDFKYNLYRDIDMACEPGEADSLQPGEVRVFSMANDVLAASENEVRKMRNLQSKNSNPEYFSYIPFPGLGQFTRGTSLSIDTGGTQNRTNNDRRSFGPAASIYWPTPQAGNNNKSFSGGVPDLQHLTSGFNMSTPIENLVNGLQLRGFYWRKKGVQASEDTQFIWADSPVPMFMPNSGTKAGPFHQNNYMHYNCEKYITDIGIPYNNSSNELKTITDSRSGHITTTYGDYPVGVTPPTGVPDRFIFFDIPTQPMLSLGQFMHSWPRTAHMTNNDGYRATGDLAIGGSIGNHYIPPDKTAADVAGWTYDDSFLVNKALFDSYFFSTVPPADTPPASTTWPDAWTDFVAGNSDTSLTDTDLPLLNPRMLPRDDITVAMSELRAPATAAANLFLDGAFNVNSTSVRAWKAFLRSMSGAELPIYNVTNELIDTVSAPVDGAIIPRFWSAMGSASTNNRWNGVRRLEKGELQRLAEEIVRQVKLRGPFLSMADFLNRRLGNASELTRMGALQAAIDLSGINNSVEIGVNVEGYINGPYAHVNHVNPDMLKEADESFRDLSVGVPGYLLQQDLVQAYSPAMAPRSDTFVIRTYGASNNAASDDVDGEVWLEAVVQRLPEYLVPTDSPETSPSDLTSTLNQNFGRRFAVQSIRWLSADEI